MPEDKPKRPPTYGDRGEVRRPTPPKIDTAAPVFVDPAQEPTGVSTDPQVFRSLKALHKRLDENEKKAERAHGELSKKVDGIKTAVDARFEKFDEKLDTVAEGFAGIKGYIDGQTKEREIAARSKSPSSMMRLQHGDATVTLAGKIVDDQLRTREWWRTQTAKLLGAGGIGGAVTWILHHIGVL